MYPHSDIRVLNRALMVAFSTYLYRAPIIWKYMVKLGQKEMLVRSAGQCFPFAQTVLVRRHYVLYANCVCFRSQFPSLFFRMRSRACASSSSLPYQVFRFASSISLWRVYQWICSWIYVMFDNQVAKQFTALYQTLFYCLPLYAFGLQHSVQFDIV